MLLVGDFTEEDCKNKVDKQAVEKMQKETGLDYTITKIVKRKGIKYLRIYVCDVYEWADIPLEKELKELMK